MRCSRGIPQVSGDCGPCSADLEDAVLDYVTKLAGIQRRVKGEAGAHPPGVHQQAPHHGEGYKGMLHQPSPDKAPDLLGGIIAIRKMHPGDGGMRADLCR